MFEKIGTEYKTLSGYSELIHNYQNYESWLRDHNIVLKAEVINKLTSIFQTLHINMGVNEVKRIEDINVCTKLFELLYKSGFRLGADLYNRVCSGDVTGISRISDKHFSLFAKDNNGAEIFKFKSLIIYNPEFNADFSPIFIFESDDDDELNQNEASAKREEYSKKGKFLAEGMKISTEDNIIYDHERLNELCYRIDNEEIDFAYHHVTKYFSKAIFCIINIQGLNYGKFDDLVERYYDMDGVQFEMLLRKALTQGE